MYMYIHVCIHDVHVYLYYVHVHCIFRLEGVEARLQETLEAFEQSRAVAKKTKSDYELVKKMR